MARWLAKNPELDTQNGTTKFIPTRIHVAFEAWPPKITDPWLMSDSTVPTNNAIGMHRESEGREKTMASRRGGGAGSGIASCARVACCTDYALTCVPASASLE